MKAICKILLTVKNMPLSKGFDSIKMFP